jgi:hypothetical protein
MKIVDLVMKLLTDRMPRKAALAAIAMVVMLLLVAILVPTLGVADGNAQDRNVQLKASIAKTTKGLAQAEDDQKYVVSHEQEYEDLLHGDRLVPHTERVAITQMQTLYQQRGLSALTYTFTAGATRAVASAGKPSNAGGYKLKLETVTLKVGAPLDTQVYDFMMDLGENFPGTAVVEGFTLERAAEITTDELNQVAHGQDSGLVKGEIVFTWRTAEKEQETDKGKAKQ